MKRIPPLRFTPRLASSNGPAPGRPSPGAGDAAEFKQLILPHLDGAYNLARYLTRDSVASEDVVQDAMIRAFRAFGQFRGGSARAWLFAIVRNCCRTAQGGTLAATLVVHENRLSDDEVARLKEHPDPGLTPEDEMMRGSEVERVRAAVEAIPEPFREAVVLRDLEDLSYGEIAEVTGVPVGTVMSRLSRGRATLAKELLPAGRDGQLDQSRSVK